ncbi:hypothetical protein O181_108069 [Austropuccinia psidii MF-1]|uniref:Uncharacterized protein n=1 Tax=Austropuccinia psidii MF-1 TaxID=1389203 RepID=A0A9Q3PNL9_9BASI|nr:hypothetical protein [Austropuccinia psidii MF-1]
MDSAPSSKIPHNPDESKEEIINGETMQGQEDIADVERLHQRMLKMQQELIELLKKEGKRKESSFTAENSPMEETTSMARIFILEGSPSPFSSPMASSTPFTSQRQNTLPKQVNIHAQASSPVQPEIPQNNTPIVKIIPKNWNLWFDGKEVEILIKRVENIAEIEGESGRDIARQIFFWTEDQEISCHIGEIPGYETGDWEQLNLDMNRRWGTVSPERRYKLTSITQLFTKIKQEGGIRNMTQNKKFIGECESIINYLKRYQYIQGDINHNQEILASLSSSVQESIYKVMIEYKAMVQAFDGGYIIPRLEILRLYIEQDLEAKVLIQQKGFSQPKSQEKKARFEEEIWEEVLKQMKDLTQKIQNPQLQGNQSKDTGKKSVKEVFNQLKHLSEVVESPKKRKQAIIKI